ncbi:MAG: hypothetical protein JNM56_32875 [Planctomycetia bacterium]|nr:hypothetical protein [Planctomycetia bacterium]
MPLHDFVKLPKAKRAPERYVNLASICMVSHHLEADGEPYLRVFFGDDGEPADIRDEALTALLAALEQRLAQPAA